MQIPVYQSQVGIQNGQGGRSADYQNPHAFVSARDNRLPHDLHQLAKGLGALGGTLHTIEIEKRAEKLALDVTTDIQSALAQDSAIQRELQEQFRGEDAAQSVEEYAKRTEQLMNGLTAKYQNNPHALQHIQERLGSTFLSGTNAMHRYKDEQYTAYQGGVIDRQLSIMEEVYTNPNSSFEQKQQASQDYALLRRQQLTKKGWDTESVQRQIDDDLKAFGVKNTLQQLDYLEKTNPIEGLKMMDGALTGKVDTPRGIRNNNPGNIVKTASAWDGEIEGNDKRFKSFATPEHGIKAIANNLISYDKKGINTVSGIINRWAPPHENNTQAYVTQVSRALNVSPHEPLDLKSPEVLTQLTETIIAHENGGIPYTMAQVDAGVNAALGIAPLPEPANIPEGEPQHEEFLPTKVAELKTFLTPQQLMEKRASMKVAAEKQEQANAIQQYSYLAPEEAVLAVARDPDLIARPDLQKKVMGHFDLMAASQKRIADAQEAEVKGERIGAIENVDLTSPDSSRQLEQIISDAPYAMQSELTKIAKARIEGEDKITDPVAYDEAEQRLLAGEKVNIRGEYGGKLNLVSQRRLEKIQSNNEFKEFVIKEKDFFNREVDKHDKKMPKSERSDLYRRYEASIPDGGYRDITQRQKAFATFWRSVTVDKPWSREKEIRGYEEKEYAEKGYYPSTGKAYWELYHMTKQQIKEREGADREPTEKELLNVYQAALGISKGGK